MKRSDEYQGSQQISHRPHFSQLRFHLASKQGPFWKSAYHLATAFVTPAASSTHDFLSSSGSFFKWQSSEKGRVKTSKWNKGRFVTCKKHINVSSQVPKCLYQSCLYTAFVLFFFSIPLFNILRICLEIGTNVEFHLHLLHFGSNLVHIRI